MSNNFTRQIFVFIVIWALLIFIFISSTSRKENDSEVERLNQALSYLEKTKSLDNELKHLLDDYANEISNPDTKLELLKKINSRFQESGVSQVTSPNSPAGTPSLEYEQYRRRVQNNILELWNFIFAEAQKLEKTLKNDGDTQQALKQLTSFAQMAVEQKR